MLFVALPVYALDDPKVAHAKCYELAAKVKSGDLNVDWQALLLPVLCETDARCILPQFARTNIALSRAQMPGDNRSSMMRVIVPTLNAAQHWPLFAPALLACARPEQVLIVDSESTDGTAELARAAGFSVCSVSRAEFDHGGTRQMAAEMLSDADILLYMTQDAVLDGPDALSNLLIAFDDPQVGAAYGRQLPRPQAKAIETHARSFNYPPNSEIRTLASREKRGIKTVFLSNSLAAYRRTALMSVGGFPANVILGEDTIVAAHLLLAGRKVAYVAEARAYHSHPYSLTQEFKRYFDTGVLHRRERWLLEEFGQARGEGKRFVLSELRYLAQHDAWQIPYALVRTISKFLGYQLGRMEAQIPPQIKRHLSMHSSFWMSRNQKT
jgi:rhamnosyltransferase